MRDTAVACKVQSSADAAKESSLAAQDSAFRFVVPTQGPLSLALCNAEVAQSMVYDANVVFVDVSTEGPANTETSQSSLSPCTLGQIKHFKDLVDVTIEGEKCSNMVVCAGTETRPIMTFSYLIGSYMILCLDSPLADVVSAFRPVADRFERFRIGIEPDRSEELTVFDCWEALYRSKVQGWIDLASATPDLDHSIDMEEYMHYDNPANGKLHVIIPSRLIAFPCPSDLEADEVSGQVPPWMDIAGDRYFGPDYYADILCDFDVKLVVRCDAAATYDAAAFASRGVAVERLGGDLERRPERLLQEVDRFLTLAQLAPGMIGIHGADAGLGSGGEMLVASLLVKRHGFRARAALAWLSITHPGHDARRTLRFAVRPNAAPAAHRSAADIRLLCPRLGGSRPSAAMLRRCASAPAVLEGKARS